jgi:hypothetical protein
MIPIPQNPAHWHILLAHIPALLYMVSIVILALATFWRDVRWQRVALGFIVVATITTGITFKMGEEGEDIVETLPGTEQYIHPHEELAETARNIILPFGILILALWWFTRKHTLLPAWASWGAIAVMTGIIILLANVAGAGGKINHPEIRPGFSGGAWEQDDHGGDRDKDKD